MCCRIYVRPVNIYIYYILGHEWEIGMRKETLMQMQDKLYWENMREKENG